MIDSNANLLVTQNSNFVKVNASGDSFRLSAYGQSRITRPVVRLAKQNRADGLISLGGT